VPVIIAVPEPFSTIVWLPGVPVTVYVTVAFGVPVNVTVALPPEQTLTFALIETVGGGVTVIVIVPVAGAVHPGEPVVATLTKV
jgi:hypothetical protein